VPLGDLSVGMYGVIGILAALESRRVTGKGQYIDVAMLDCQVAMLTYQAAYYLASGKVPGRQGRTHESIPTYRCFTSRDGREVVVCANTDRMWQSLCEVAGLPELRDDPELQSRKGRYKHWDLIVSTFDRVFATRDADDWVKALRAANVPVATVQNLDEVFSSEQVQVRDMVLELPGPNGETLRVAGNPIKTSFPGGAHRFPPKLAQDTADVLGDLLKLKPEEIGRLQASGVIEGVKP
jgi:crotonobetainyl-CoA:carnitine CoA-transferase CaiB-like acyl-CoA transferase